MSKAIYLECSMGAAGDMLTAAMYELLSPEEQKEFLHMANHHGLTGVTVSPLEAEKCGVKGTHMQVLIDGAEEDEHHEHHGHHEHHEHHGHHEHQHHHANLAQVYEMIDSYDIQDSVKQNAKKVYNRIAEAEAHAHGKAVTEVHFHEVGMKDAIADVVNVCWIANKLNVDSIIASAINVGSGTVKCAHGILPVPAPATAYLLQGAPTYQGDISGEMCTPTGAALLQHMKTAYGKMPAMRIDKIGYGMGKKDFPQANCVRAFLGELTYGVRKEKIVELSCNLDDMTGEELAFASEILRNAGALDVYLQSIQMKKNRPGEMLVCLCKETDEMRMTELILANTTTWGVRRTTYDRYALERNIEEISTPYGSVRVKKGTGYGVEKWKAEYDDMAELAKVNHIPLKEVERQVLGAIR